jgi:hypothetical protein
MPSVALLLLLKDAPGTAMLRLTVALIVVTLTGLPVLPTMCHTWCGEDKTIAGSCHDEAVGNGSAAVITVRAECRALVTVDPFIRDDARPVLHAVPLPHAARASAPALLAAAHTFAFHRPASVAAPAPPLVLRV